jgi:hypothetical protein
MISEPFYEALKVAAGPVSTPLFYVDGNPRAISETIR